MEFALDKLNAEDVLHQLVNLGVGQLPFGGGLVATPVPEAKTGEGLGWSYFNFLHVASSAWTGLALLARDDPGANPYAPLSKVGH